MGRFLLDLFFPRHCPICDDIVKPFGELICKKCKSKVKFVSGPLCYKCGKPLENDTIEYCSDCKKRRHFYKQGMSVFEYKSVSDAIYRFKYKNRQEYVDYFGEQMARYLGQKIKATGAQALIPVPIHKTKYRKRGYNQAELIARSLSNHIRVPVENGLIYRQKNTKPLKDLAPAERNINLNGAFKLACNGVKLETIVIIDDIYTTGATIDAMSQELMKAGVKNIYFATLSIGRGL